MQLPDVVDGETLLKSKRDGKILCRLRLEEVLRAKSVMEMKVTVG